MYKESRTMHRRAALLLLVVLALVCLLAGCGAPRTELQPPENAQVLTDSRAVELFRDPRQWNMPQLLDHQLYLLDGRLYAEFLFDKAADADQIDRARSYSLRSFVLTDAYILGEYPYGELIIGQAKQAADATTWEAVTCRVYNEKKLLYGDVFDRVYLDEDR